MSPNLEKVMYPQPLTQSRRFAHTHAPPFPGKNLLKDETLDLFWDNADLVKTSSEYGRDDCSSESESADSVDPEPSDSDSVDDSETTPTPNLFCVGDEVSPWWVHDSNSPHVGYLYDATIVRATAGGTKYVHSQICR